MANDLTALLTLVTGELNRGDVTSAQITTEIQSAIRDYEALRFWFNEKSIQFTISATVTYALSTLAAKVSGADDIIEVDDLSVQVSGYWQSMQEVTWEEYGVRAVATTVTGIPTIYSIFDESLYIWPMPDTTYTGALTAHIKYTELSAGADTNPWCTDARELVRNAALARIFMWRLRDPDNARMAQYGAEQALNFLMRRTDAQSGHVTNGGTL